jgi:hypothetical protein
MRFAGSNRRAIDLKRLRAILSRKQPPVDFCLPEFGLAGPLLGTIHASKGRECDDVHLMIPPEQSEEADVDYGEEIRVVFVGATRARSRLLHASGFRTYSRILEGSGRIYTPKRKNGRINAWVQIGLAADVDAEGLAGRICFADPEAVEAAQGGMRALPPDAELCARLTKLAEKDWRHGIAASETGDRLGYLSPSFTRDLLSIGGALQHGQRLIPSSRFNRLHCFGTRTFAVPESDASLLHEPWRNSRLITAPMITGSCYFTYSDRNGK